MSSREWGQTIVTQCYSANKRKSDKDSSESKVGKMSYNIYDGSFHTN